MSWSFLTLRIINCLLGLGPLLIYSRTASHHCECGNFGHAIAAFWMYWLLGELFDGFEHLQWDSRGMFLPCECIGSLDLSSVMLDEQPENGFRKSLQGNREMCLEAWCGCVLEVWGWDPNPNPEISEPPRPDHFCSSRVGSTNERYLSSEGKSLIPSRGPRERLC